MDERLLIFNSQAAREALKKTGFKKDFKILLEQYTVEELSPEEIEKLANRVFQNTEKPNPTVDSETQTSNENRHLENLKDLIARQLELNSEYERIQEQLMINYGSQKEISKSVTEIRELKLELEKIIRASKSKTKQQ